MLSIMFFSVMEDIEPQPQQVLLNNKVRILIIIFFQGVSRR